MHFQTLANLLAFAGITTALSDSAPWIVLSTAAFKTDANLDQIQTSMTALRATKDILAECPTDNYAVVAQSGVHYSTMLDHGRIKMATIRNMMDNQRTKGQMVVPEVLGATDAQDILMYISEVCSGKRDAVDAKYLELETESGDVASSDATMELQLKTLLASDSMTLIFVGQSNKKAEPTAYEPNFGEAMNLDLKRSVQGSLSRRDNNETDWDKLPLFEKYQFFTPGIFVGIVATLVLGSILVVGLKALASLEVSYGAFDKDMGPAAQKKQQ